MAHAAHFTPARATLLMLALSASASALSLSAGLFPRPAAARAGKLLAYEGSSGETVKVARDALMSRAVEQQLNSFALVHDTARRTYLHAQWTEFLEQARGSSATSSDLTGFISHLQRAQATSVFVPRRIFRQLSPGNPYAPKVPDGHHEEVRPQAIVLSLISCREQLAEYWLELLPSLSADGLVVPSASGAASPNTTAAESAGSGSGGAPGATAGGAGAAPGAPTNGTTKGPSSAPTSGPPHAGAPRERGGVDGGLGEPMGGSGLFGGASGLTGGGVSSGGVSSVGASGGASGGGVRGVGASGLSLGGDALDRQLLLGIATKVAARQMLHELSLRPSCVHLHSWLREYLLVSRAADLTSAGSVARLHADLVSRPVCLRGGALFDPADLSLELYQRSMHILDLFEEDLRRAPEHIVSLTASFFESCWKL